MAKRKKYKTERISLEAKIGIGLAIFVAATFAFFIFSTSEVGAKFLNSLFWHYCSRVLLSVLLVFLAFFKRKKRVPLYATILLVIYVVMMWTVSFLPIRIDILFNLLWTVAATIASVTAFVKMKDKDKDKRTPCRLDFVIGYVFLSSITFLLKIKYISKNAFLLPTIFIGIIGLIGAFLFVIKFKDKIIKPATKIFIPFAAMIFVAVFAYISLTTLNFCLDFNKPVIQSAKIVDKDINKGPRMPTIFELNVIINGEEIKISVPSDVYYNLKSGEYINLSKYKGFFNQSYYFYDNAN